MSKPVIVFATRLHDVNKGSYIHLTCRATGNPTPSITWSFFAIGEKMPTNIRLTNNGADIHIDSVTDMNYGHYACKAHNSQGDDIRYIDIFEHSPSGP
ncbi:neurotrimin-like [Mizuhopecten yessoensis]|nr:neurotrimin-like [Mizuhopecten yessoensis]